MFFIFSASVAGDEPKDVSQATLLLCHHNRGFLYPCVPPLSSKKMCGKLIGNGGKIEKQTLSILPSLCRIPAATTAAFRSSTGDDCKRP